MNALGLYVPGTSVVHRLPAGSKLVLLLVVGAGSVLLDRWWQVAVLLVLVLAGYPLAGLSLRTAASQVRPLVWIAGVAAVLHVVLSGWERAGVVLGVLAALVLLAALVTLTTRATAMVDAIVTLCRPLRVVGVDPERVGLVLTLGIRCVPVVVGLAEEVREAQLARGLGASPRAFAVPLLVRSLRHADALGEALVARGVED
ncbi:MAG TPA: energy-coupling factor transporter transmembrane protein EcfT [Nocardioides sp.]|nr:energy-coupling factor transporter transmembrane protein EcfT [Nocardioides sp.]